MTDKWRGRQLDVCRQFGAEPWPVGGHEKIGIALATLDKRPLRGIRESPEHGTCGWYVCGGTESSTDPDYFQPLHVVRLAERCPLIIPMLLLPPGWAFEVADGYMDCWNTKKSA